MARPGGTEGQPSHRQRLQATDVLGPAFSRSIDSNAAHSYEQYAASDASVGINRYTASLISDGRSRVVVDGIGTGADVEALIETGRFAPGFQVVGNDIDPTSLEVTRKKFANYKGANLTSQINLVEGSGDSIPVRDGWADLVLCLNAVHLFPDLEEFFLDAYRVSQPGGELALNSAYVKDSMYANEESKKAVQSMLGTAVRSSIKAGHRPTSLYDPARFTMEQYMEFAEKAGFVDVKIEPVVVHMNLADVEAIFSTEEFQDGALPGVPYEVAKPSLVDTIRPAMERAGIETVDRIWNVMTAKKPLDESLPDLL